MQEENPWLDTQVLKHNNIKAVKPVIKTDVPKTNKSKTDVKPVIKTDIKPVIKTPKLDRETISINTIQKDKYENFLESILNELTLHDKSKKFAVDNFGKKWLEDFLKDVDELKYEILNSKFFPSQKEMILLKFIFLIQQFWKIIISLKEYLDSFKNTCININLLKMYDVIEPDNEIYYLFGDFIYNEIKDKMEISENINIEMFKYIIGKLYMEAILGYSI